MKKRLVLKPYVIPTFYVLFFAFVIGSLFFSITYTESEDDLTYVNGVIFDDYIPVVNEEIKMVKPYNNDNVDKTYGFYSKDLDEESQKGAIIVYKNTYIQNTGITYSNNDSFEINSIYDGEVIDVSKKELLGNTITIKHDKDIISSYNCLDDIKVKKGDKVLNGQVIATSGTCDLFNKNSNLFFELYNSGTIVNPEDYYDKDLKEIQ